MRRCLSDFGQGGRTDACARHAGASGDYVVQALRRERQRDELQGVGQVSEDELCRQPQHGDAHRRKHPVPA